MASSNSDLGHGEVTLGHGPKNTSKASSHFNLEELRISTKSSRNRLTLALIEGEDESNPSADIVDPVMVLKSPCAPEQAPLSSIKRCKTIGSSSKSSLELA